MRSMSKMAVRALLFFSMVHCLPMRLIADVQAPLTDDQKYDDKMNALLRELAVNDKAFDISKSGEVLDRAPHPTTDLPKAQMTTLDDGELYHRSVAATVALYANSVSRAKVLEGAQLGAAFVIDRSGIAVTCFHAIRFNEPFVMAACTIDGKRVGVKSLLGIFPGQDVAFIQLDGDSFDSLPLRLDAPAGTQVRLLGHPLGLHFFMAQGLLARYEKLPNEGIEKLSRPRMDLSVQVGEGFSGGPVLDCFGNVIGMQDSMSTTHRNDESYTIGLAIPAEMLSSCLNGTYHEELSPQQMQGLYAQAPKSVPADIVMETSLSDGKVVVSRTAKGVNVIVVEKSTGKIVAEGAPSAAFRATLPAWARLTYDDNIVAIQQIKPVSDHKSIKVESSCAQGKVVSEVDGTNTKVSVWDASAHLISEGTPGDAFRTGLPAWARDVYDTNMSALHEAVNK